MSDPAQDGPRTPETQARPAAIPGSGRPMPGSRGGLAASRPPSGFSRKSRKRWVDLHRANDFAVHEDDLLESYLTWDDVATALRQEAKGLRGRERDRKLKAAEDAATTALRYLRGLRFVDPATPTRRPGRPPGKPRPPEDATVLRVSHA